MDCIMLRWVMKTPKLRWKQCIQPCGRALLTVTVTPHQNKKQIPLTETLHLPLYCPKMLNALKPDSISFLGQSSRLWNVAVPVAKFHRYYFCWKWVIALFLTGQGCGYASCRCLALLCSFIQTSPQRTSYMISVQNNSTPPIKFCRSRLRLMKRRQKDHFCNSLNFFVLWMIHYA